MLTNRFENENDEEDSNQFNIDFEHKFNKQGHKLTTTLQKKKMTKQKFLTSIHFSKMANLLMRVKSIEQLKIKSGTWYR